MLVIFAPNYFFDTTHVFKYIVEYMYIAFLLTIDALDSFSQLTGTENDHTLISSIFS